MNASGFKMYSRAAKDAQYELIERYARKAITIGAPAADATPLPPLGPVRTVVVAEQDREAAIRASMPAAVPV